RIGGVLGEDGDGDLFSVSHRCLRRSRCYFNIRARLQQAPISSMIAKARPDDLPSALRRELCFGFVGWAKAQRAVPTGGHVEPVIGPRFARTRWLCPPYNCLGSGLSREEFRWQATCSMAPRSLSTT